MHKRRKTLSSLIFLSSAAILFFAAVFSVRAVAPPAAPHLDPLTTTSTEANGTFYIVYNASWNSVSGANYYFVYYRTPPSTGAWTQWKRLDWPNIIETSKPLFDEHVAGKTFEVYVVACTNVPGGTYVCSSPSNYQTVFVAATPYVPTYINGSSTVRVNTPYTYSTTLYQEPDGGQVKAVFDWGDGTTGETSFISPLAYPSGTSVSLSHTWTSAGDYNVRVKSKNSFGLESGWQTYLSTNGNGSNVITVDTQAPSVPAGLTATPCAADVNRGCYPSASQINLSWNESTDNVGVAGYKIYRNGTLLADNNYNGVNYYDADVSAGTPYSYTVAAYDEVGNISEKSSPVVATIAAPDTQSPSAPTGLTATAIATTQINLTWNAATDNVGTVGYKIFRNGDFINTTVNLSYNDHNQHLPDYFTTLPPATTYTYKVAAYDAAQNLSPQSSAVSATTMSEGSGIAGSNPPAIPATPTSASNSGVAGTAYTFSSKLFPDPDGNKVKAVFDWGDDTTSDNSSGLITPVSGGTAVSASHVWSKSGTYSIAVYALDSLGLASDWSSPATIKITAVNTTPSIDNGTTTDDGTTTPVVTPVVDMDNGTTTQNGTTTPAVIPLEDKTPPNVDKVVTATVKFTRNLKVGSKGDDVKALQQILINEGVFPKGSVTGYFNLKTKAAVVKFQNKYKSELLTPLGRKKGNGVVGLRERAKLNAL